MITFLTHPEHSYTLNYFSEVLEERYTLITRVLSYDNILDYNLDYNIVVFCDIERYHGALSCKLLDALKLCYEALEVKILNNPINILTRYNLIKKLKESNLIDYNCYRKSDGWTKVNFPVFIRREHDHMGTLTELIYGEKTLNEKLKEFECEKDLLLIEYHDIRKSKTIKHHKFGILNIDGKLIPRHLFFSHYWVVKRPQLQSEEDLRLEQQYVLNTEIPFSDTIRRIFDIARIDFGRMDYAIDSKDNLVCFEINTNPTILDHGDITTLKRLPITNCFLEMAYKTLNQL